ncbi:MAG: hypothetical protein ABSB42_02500 [Tepidisphaeraceae bacterium]|jgi:hypothetical protein
MIVELNEGYFIDASDGANWTLMKVTPGRKNPVTLGYHSNVYNALEAAVRHGAATNKDRVKLADLPKWLDALARRICQDARVRPKGVPRRVQAACAVEGALAAGNAA